MKNHDKKQENILSEREAGPMWHGMSIQFESKKEHSPICSRNEITVNG